MKMIVVRFINGFCYAIAITTVFQLIVMMVTGTGCMLPEYAERFSNSEVAFCVQMLLIGCISGVASAGGVIMELKRPGLLVQSALFLLLLLVTWLPVACFLWSIHKYTISMISVISSLLVTYLICWMVEYKLCVRDVQEINKRLQAR